MVSHALIPCIALVFVAGLAIHKAAISQASRLGLVDIPSARRRHARPTPIVGGVCVFLAWALGLGAFVLGQPEWGAANRISLLAIGASIVSLMALGIWDDIQGLGPRTKLLVQTAAAAGVMLFEPHFHSVCLEWQARLGIGGWIWALVGVWVVGITNAINLVDGLDGLAGGISFLVCGSVLALGIVSGGPDADFAIVVMALVLPALLGFLWLNWNPARVFLGDNGSLPLGFLIAVISPLCRPRLHADAQAWVTLASIPMMLGYPILDMGLAVGQRYRRNLLLFKADRNHLHYRIQRLGLSARETLWVLLGISAFLQATAFALNLMTPLGALTVISMVGISLCTLLFLVDRIENRNRRDAVATVQARGGLAPEKTAELSDAIGLFVELRPLIDVGLLEERERYGVVVESLRHFLRAQVRPNDVVFDQDQRIAIVFDGFVDSPGNRARVKERFARKVGSFLELSEIHGSLSAMPIRWGRIKPAHAGERPPDVRHHG